MAANPAEKLPPPPPHPAILSASSKTGHQPRFSDLVNPFPFLREAQRSASRIAFLQRDLYTLTAEITAVRQAKRIAFGVAGLVFVTITLNLTFFWATAAIHEAGVASWVLSLLSLVIFGAVAGLLFWMAVQAGRAPERSDEKDNVTPIGGPR